MKTKNESNYIIYYSPSMSGRTYSFICFSSSSVPKSAVKTYTEYFYHPTADNASAANRYFYAFALYMRVHVIESSGSLKNDYKEANTIRIHTSHEQCISVCLFVCVCICMFQCQKGPRGRKH